MHFSANVVISEANFLPFRKNGIYFRELQLIDEKLVAFIHLTNGAQNSQRRISVVNLKETFFYTSD